MQLTFLGAAKTVTGSKYLITTGQKKILIDCGLYQGYKELRAHNWEQLPIDAHHIDAVLLTHAHIDHTGYLPRLIKNGFKGKIFCTHGTKDLCSILLPDSGYLQEEDAQHANRHGYSKHRPALPLYTQQDGIHALLQFYPLDFDKTYKIFNDIYFSFLPAGHIIGSSIIRFEHLGRSIIFTGDLGRPHDPLMKAPAIVTEADYIVTEATYGDRLHGSDNPLDKLEAVIKETIAKSGSVIIPAFAVGRTQDILYYLYLLRKAKRIPEIPIFLDSPMAEDVSDLLVRYAAEHRVSIEECREICKIANYVRTSEESKLLDRYTQPIIIISASGMLEGGRILHHLKAFLPGSQHAVLLTGFQAPGTRGDQLQRGDKQITIHGEKVPVRAKVVILNNMSAHADYQEMLEWLSHFKHAPQKVFITHGDEPSAIALQNRINQALGWQCMVPELMETVPLK
jgi:metallo-beta-lactamase family protein